MDSYDHRLISLLRENARLSIAQLATQLGVSRGTVQNRIDKLIEQRVLLGFTVRTTSEAAAHRVRAVMMISVEGDRSDAILKSLRGYPEVRALHTTNGRWDIVAELGTDTLETFDEALRSIRTIKGISNSETNLLLSTHKV
ncbi:MAG: Lrp/AsnC family transcriptional regulator [Gemmatimonadaceae bacterium]